MAGLGRLNGGRLYGWFEKGVALALTIGVMGVIIISIGHLAGSLYSVAMAGFAEFDYSDFQSIFEKILTVLIALEFNLSLAQVLSGTHGFIQVRTVVLIGILAVVRKVIVLDIDATSGIFLIGLAAAILALGAVYIFMVREDQA